MRPLPRPVRSLATFAAMVVAASLLVAASAGPRGAPADAASPPSRSTWVPVRSAGILTLDWGDIDATADAWRGNYLVLEPWEGARIPALKAKNPRLKVLMYNNVASVRKDSHESGIYSTGLSYREAQAGGWLLSDAAGRTLQWSDWSDLYPTDVGATAYQDRWASNVLGELRSAAWDGVMMDDTLTSLSHTTVGDRVSTQIPTDQAMYAATERFLARVATRVRSSGFLAVPNLTVQWNTWHAVVTDWTRYVSGWENEYFVKWGLDRAGARFAGADWTWKADLASWLAARDVPLLAVTYSNRSDLAAQIYHRATWLMTWNGRTGSSVFVPSESDVNHWTAASTVEIGTPTQVRRLVGTTGVWRRAYTRGTALVNPTATSAVVQVTAGSRTLGGTPVTRVRVPARSGMILRHG
ncbi:putative glycoside hydrolase [Nocardioides plantarum]|uniref:Glycoside hydrolase n=1 Tax=Nocardioides plantarum TaxID=29299 RepID=A0ABV5KED3_9ACTN|nr:putative glycoside hydrolase [Nocardioides plantarum]